MRVSLRDPVRRGAGDLNGGGGTGHVACRAPFTSMYLDQHGDVRACCMNDRHPMGNVTRDRLADIWHGSGAEALREAMEAGDLGLGCDFCAAHVDGGRPDLAYSRWFAAFTMDEPCPRWPRQLELSLSNTCNLRCVMCNGEWSSSIRSHVEGREPLPSVYDDGFFADLRAFLPHLERVKFYGGEPFLASETLRVMEMLVDEGLSTRCHVTTNGTHWTPRVERILSMLPVDVSVSLDAATRETYESVRRGSSWDDMRRNLDRFCEWAERRGTWVSVTFCLMTVNWHEMGAFFALADELGVDATVNQVTRPEHLSLHHLGVPELAQLVERLDAEDEERGPALQQNRPMWEGELATLRRHLADERIRQHTPLAFSLAARAAAADRPLEKVSPRLAERLDADASARAARAEAVAVCGRYVRRGSPRLDLDEDGRVRWADGAGVLGIAGGSLLGRHHSELQAIVAEALGEVVGVDHRYFAPGTELSVVRLSAGRVVHVLAAPAVGAKGTSLYFSWGAPDEDGAR